MSGIRSEFSAEFIEKITEGFVRQVAEEGFSGDEVRAEIAKVRDGSSHPLTLEMELAMCRVALADAWRLIDHYEQGKGIVEALMRVSAIEADLQASIIAYLEKQPSRAKAAQDAKWKPVRQFALDLANAGSYPSRRQAVLAIKDDVVAYANSLPGVSMSAQQAEKTIDGWLRALGYTPTARKQGTPAR